MTTATKLTLGEVSLTRVIEIGRSSFPTTSPPPASHRTGWTASSSRTCMRHFPRSGVIVREDRGLRLRPVAA